MCPVDGCLAAHITISIIYRKFLMWSLKLHPPDIHQIHLLRQDETVWAQTIIPISFTFSSWLLHNPTMWLADSPLSHLNLYTLHIRNCPFNCDIFNVLIIIVVSQSTIIKNLLRAIQWATSYSYRESYDKVSSIPGNIYYIKLCWLFFGGRSHVLFCSHNWYIVNWSIHVNLCFHKSYSGSFEDLTSYYWALFFRSRWKPTYFKLFHNQIAILVRWLRPFSL